ncbi:DsbA family protein [Boudabousia marimammalium]|uniref:Thioredoxin-like fold domain-containing protein n=1 Tax=Boudabousia marimammalium TaxID=156892 RepID=A0A1Q5PJ62_9ACTO|nr:thioredoxin domain-containing protein [Boudabousia marimammalium]OKL45899.1 hypothetical protein BM477_07790 [Boudabousia marimammalium]
MGRPQGPKPQASIKNRAAQMRAEEEKKARRMRAILWGSVIALLVVAIVIVTWVATHRDKVGPAADALGDFNGGKPIVLYQDKVTATVPEGVSVVDEYVSYTCSHCAVSNEPIGDKLVERAQKGEFALRLNLVPTATMPFTSASTAGALITAKASPDKFKQYHDQIFAFVLQQIEANDGSVLNDTSASVAKVQEIMRGLGVPDGDVNKLTGQLGDDYLATASKNWAEAKIEGRDERYGTPMYVVNGTEVKTSEHKTAEDLLAAIDKSAKK